jgi:alginate O-acetyltransferase complex protein AlgI
MVFSSISFLCLFLPVTLLGSLLLPWMRAKNVLLVVASLLFYAWGEPLYVVLMLLSVVCNWGFGLAMGTTARRPARRKAVLVLAVFVNIGLLAVFKYANLLVQTLNIGFAIDLPFAEIALPIGISFYTFQALSYCIDVYRGVDEPGRDFVNVLLFISFFPQLIAGPIIKYHDVCIQIVNRKQTISGLATGLRRFSVGLAKKVLIANTLGEIADNVFSAQPAELNIAVAWLGALAYLGQIYFDFSGYSDMAIGLARCFGFNYRENFNYPYTATSIRDFWRRWHISLSTWFKEYLYIPLGGSRKGRPRAALNKLAVFALCGLWHGASWTFLVWGLFHGLFLFLEEYLPIRKLPKPLGWVYAMLVVCVGFVFFRANDFAEAICLINQMFLGWHFDALPVSYAMQQLDPVNILTLAIAVIAATPIAAKLKVKIKQAGANTEKLAGYASFLGATALFVLSVMALSGGGYNPFIYFRF